MILASHFEDTRKSILNISAQIIHVINERHVDAFKLVVTTVENELQVSYAKVVLAVNFLYMLGKLEYDVNKDTLRLINETK